MRDYTHEVTLMGKNKFDTRPKIPNSASAPQALEYWTDADGKVRVREHIREGTVVKEHSRRKSLLNLFKPKVKKRGTPKPTNKSTSSREFMNDFDIRANALEKSLIHRSEDTF